MNSAISSCGRLPRSPATTTRVAILVCCLGLFCGRSASFRQPLVHWRTREHGIVESARMRAARSYGNIPLSFEANKGQSDVAVRFQSRGNGYSLFLTRTEAVLVLREPAPGMLTSRPTEAERTGSIAILRMKLAGGNPAPEVTGMEELPGKTNYFLGNDAAQWHTDVATYHKVKYRNVYPGVDLIYYGNQSQLEFDLALKAGAEPGTIRLTFEGAKWLEIGAAGDLIVHIGTHQICLRKPFIYQEANGVRQPIAGAYVLKEANEVGIQLGDYDLNRPLVIDPVLSYSTYLGGNVSDAPNGIAVTPWVTHT